MTLPDVDGIERCRDEVHRIGAPEMRSVTQCHAFLRERRVTLETGRASVPSLADAIAGRRLSGSWMANPEVALIYKLANRVSTETFPRLPLVEGKQTFVDGQLALAVDRVACDDARRAAAVQLLSAPATSLLAAVETAPVRMDEWPTPTAEGRRARSELERQLLTWTDHVHTDSGHHAAVVSPWMASPLYARAGARPDAIGDAERQLLSATLRSAVVAPVREVSRWFAFIDAAAVTRFLEAAHITRSGRVQLAIAPDLPSM